MRRQSTDAGSCWTQVSPSVYEKRIETNPVLGRVRAAELSLLRALSTSTTAIVDLGCGPARIAEDLASRCAVYIGLDQSVESLRYAANRHQNRRNVRLTKCDILSMEDVDRALVELDVSLRRLFVCTMNTLGILQRSDRERVLNSISGALRDGDILVLTVFRAEYFEEGVIDFYLKSQDLTGQIRPSDISTRTKTITVRSTGYSSHWFSQPELTALLPKRRGLSSEIYTSGAAMLAILQADNGLPDEDGS